MHQDAYPVRAGTVQHLFFINTQPGNPSNLGVLIATNNQITIRKFVGLGAKTSSGAVTSTDTQYFTTYSGANE